MITYNVFKRTFCLILFFCNLAWSATNTSEHILTNGLKIITIEDHRHPVAVVNFVYHVGSIYEPSHLTGISHLLEHLMYGSTSHVSHSQMEAFFNQYSGHHNAYTSNEQTVYTITIHPSDLSKVLLLEKDRLTNLRINEPAFSKEKAVVLQEKAAQLDHLPWQRALNQFRSIIFTTGGYHNPVIGYADDIKDLGVEQLKTWYDAWYVPNNLTIVVAGDIRPDQVIDNVNQVFGSLPSKKLPKKLAIEKTARHGELRLDLLEPVKNKLYVVGYLLPKPENQSLKTEIILHLVDDLLLNKSQGILSRKLIKELHIATNIYSEIDYMKLTQGYFYFFIVPNENIHFYSIKQKLNSIITQLTEASISTDRLEAAKRKLLAKYTYHLDAVREQAEEATQLDGMGLSIHRYKDIETVTQSITSADIVAFMQQYFCENCHKAILTVKPA